MHPEIERQLATQRVAELRRAGAAARVRGAMLASRRAAPEVVIREARTDDTLSIMALAVLDEAEPPLGRVLVAEVGGAIHAALPLDGPRPFSDPFRRTADLVALLEARARQIADEPARPRHRRLGWLAPAALRRLV
jgi:hypothetical protein